MASLINPDSPSNTVTHRTRPYSTHAPGTITTVSPTLLHSNTQQSVSRTRYRPRPSLTSIANQGSPAQQKPTPFPELSEAGLNSDFNTYQSNAALTGLMPNVLMDDELDASFNDCLTPDCSTDNHISEHTTPQEAIWEEQFQKQLIHTDHTHPHFLDTSSQHSGQAGSTNPSVEIHDIMAAGQVHTPQYISGAQLLSPQPTNPTTPTSPRQTPVLPAGPTQSTMADPNINRAGVSLQVSTDSATLQPHQYSPRHRPVSPVIMVSSHSHGDSPIQASGNRRRTLSRSRESLSEAFAPEPTVLVPPNQISPLAFDDGPERTGLDPNQRSQVEVPSINQLSEERQADERNQQVQHWLRTSESGTDQGEERVMRHMRSDRRRALSTGVRMDAMGLSPFSNTRVPGPGVLLDEDSADEYSEHDTDISALVSDPGSEVVESPPVVSGDRGDEDDSTSYFPPFEDDSIPPEMQEPHPNQFYRRGPWKDPPRGPIHAERWQPFSSNAAVVRYNEEAAKWESASRAATWGTGRRLSDSEVHSIIDGSRVRHLSLVQRSRVRGTTLIKRVKSKANDLMPRRSNSNIKRSAESPGTPKPVQLVESPQPRERVTGGNPLQRLSSLGKSKSPTAALSPVDTTATISRDNSADVNVGKVKSGGSRLQVIKKARSRSDVGRAGNKSSPGLQELLTRHGGPPVPSMVSPRLQAPSPVINNAIVDDDDDDDGDEPGVRMDFKTRAEAIIPNPEGFKHHALQLNPRLEPYLIDRIGQEQLRRYKKLLENRVKHAKVVRNRTCQSKTFCYSLAGNGKPLAPRHDTRDPESSGAQFSVQNSEEVNADDDEGEGGVVTPALFPAGIPKPPVKRLPAEFECPLCFKVKKFRKPSDWTKHVHEDVQPFSCTFPNCTEPRSFKRKADWVRHENERHRRLEYWKCTVNDCNHICYRKDNFVQHLVREHKKIEPKVKVRGNGNAREATERQEEENEVWQLVETCRHETSAKPRDEPCKFCGNVCNSWKKLSVHTGKHMEQIAMPILELANLKDVTADTIISPVEQDLEHNSAKGAHEMSPPNGWRICEGLSVDRFTPHMSLSPALTSQHDPSLSPYAPSSHSLYNSSAGHSPSMMPVNTQMSPFGYADQGYAVVGNNITSVPQDLDFSTQNPAFANGTPYTNNGAYGYGSIDVSQANHRFGTEELMQVPLSAHPGSESLVAASDNSFNSHSHHHHHSNDLNDGSGHYLPGGGDSFQQFPGNMRAENYLESQTTSSHHRQPSQHQYSLSPAQYHADQQGFYDQWNSHGRK